MTPTPDFTEVWRAINNGYSSLTTQRMMDSLNTIMAIGCVLMILSVFIFLLAIRYRKAIKRLLDL